MADDEKPSLLKRLVTQSPAAVLVRKASAAWEHHKDESAKEDAERSRVAARKAQLDAQVKGLQDSIAAIDREFKADSLAEAAHTAARAVPPERYEWNPSTRQRYGLTNSTWEVSPDGAMVPTSPAALIFDKDVPPDEAEKRRRSVGVSRAMALYEKAVKAPPASTYPILDAQGHAVEEKGASKLSAAAQARWDEFSSPASRSALENIEREKSMGKEKADRDTSPWPDEPKRKHVRTDNIEADIDPLYMDHPVAPWAADPQGFQSWLDKKRTRTTFTEPSSRMWGPWDKGPLRLHTEEMGDARGDERIPLDDGVNYDDPKVRREGSR